MRIKNFELSTILKTLCNKKYLLPIKRLRNSEAFFQLTEQYFIHGPRLKEATAEQGYASGYFLEIHDLLHVFNFFSRFQRRISNDFAKLLERRIEEMLADDKSMRKLVEQEQYRLMLCAIRYGSQMDLKVFNRLLLTYLSESAKLSTAIKLKDKSTLTEQIFDQDNVILDSQYKCFGVILARIANQQLLLDREFYNQLRKYHMFLESQLVDRGMLSEEKKIYTPGKAA